jgi:hypothetical protein
MSPALMTASSPKAQSAITKLIRQLLERLSQAGSDGATPTVLEIHAAQLEQMVYRRLAERLRTAPRFSTATSERVMARPSGAGLSASLIGARFVGEIGDGKGNFRT